MNGRISGFGTFTHWHLNEAMQIPATIESDLLHARHSMMDSLHEEMKRK
jgi:hypothetical protein